MNDSLAPYAGRWVALLRGEVIGVGASADEVRTSARLSQAKANPQIVFVPEPFDYELPEIVTRVRALVPEAAQVWLVGGAVRDLLLNRRVHDVDFAVDGDGLAVARRVADALGGAFYALDAERGAGRIILREAEGPAQTLDFARLRGADIFADLAGRDFTLNAIAVPLHAPDTCLDPLRGTADLRAKLIRACSATAIADDPIRGVRAVRLAAQLNFKIEKETRAAIKAHASELDRVSAERVRDEFIRCLGGPQPAASLRALDLLGLLAQIVPELKTLQGLTQSPPHTLDVWEHTLAVVARLAEVIYLLGPVHDVDAASDLTSGMVSARLGRYRAPISAHLAQPLAGERSTRWIVLLAALLHDAAKPETRTVEADGRIRFLGHEGRSAALTVEVMTRLKFSADEIRHAQLIVAHHMRPRALTREGEPRARAIYRFFRDTGAAGVDIVLLSLADFLGKYGAHPPPEDEWAHHVAGCTKMLEAYFEKREVVVAPPVLINGNDLLREFGLKPGPQIGRLLEAVREAQAAGEINTRAEALAYAQRSLENREAEAER
jgi:tRNA nucleotidyltransferase/poly(A) polymerase